MKDLVRDLEHEINEARKMGDIRVLLGMASVAIDRLEQEAGTTCGTLDENQVMGLNAAKRISYNVAADVWPGWEVGAPARSDEELQAAQVLARRSSFFVDRLGLKAMERGNAIWLIGAFDLARGRYEEALNAFGAAARFYADAPAMKLLSEGYMAIVVESSDTSPSEGAPEFDSVITRLHDLTSEDAKAFRDQLQIARQIFSHASAGE